MKLPVKVRADIGARYNLAPVPGYASSAQGAKADSALQNAGAFATAAQGVKADAAYGWGNQGPSVALLLARNPLWLGAALYEEAPVSGTPSGAYTSGDWQARPLDTERYNTIAGAVFTGPDLKLPAGTYLALADAPAYQVGLHMVGLSDATTVLLRGGNECSPAASGIPTRSTLFGVLTLAAPTSVWLKHWIQTSGGTSDGGVARSVTGVAERYAKLLLVRIA